MAEDNKVEEYLEADVTAEDFDEEKFQKTLAELPEDWENDAEGPSEEEIKEAIEYTKKQEEEAK